MWIYLVSTIECTENRARKDIMNYGNAELIDYWDNLLLELALLNGYIAKVLDCPVADV